MSGGAGNSKARQVPADDGIYTIEKIIKHRNDKKKGRLFLIKWQHWAPSHNTWEPEANILDKDLVAKYLESTKSPRGKKGGKRSADSGAAQSATSPPAQRPRIESDAGSNIESSRDSVSPEMERNTFVPVRPAETEGHFDKDDEDKDKVDAQPPSKPDAVVEKSPTEDALPTTELQQESTDDDCESPKPVAAEQPEQEAKKETEGNGPFELFGNFENGVTQNESAVFNITKQEHPDCAIKIQVNTQPIVTLPGEEDSASNLVSVPQTESVPPIDPTQTVTTSHTFVEGPAGSSYESQTTTWTESSTNGAYQYNTDFQVTQVVSDNIPVNFLEM